MLPSPFTYFDRIYCINLDSRGDRWGDMLKQFSEHDISNVRRISATVDENRFLAFNKSQFRALTIAFNNCNITPPVKPILILEDDCVFKNITHLHYAMNELPATWEVLYLGANIIGIDTIRFGLPSIYSPHLFNVRDAWQTHAVAYSLQGLRFIVENFKVDNGYNYDEWLRQVVLPRGNSFIIAPQIAYQARGYSDLWQTQADYTSLFDRGNELLK